MKETFKALNRASFLKFISFYCIYVGAFLGIFYFQLFLNTTGYLVYLFSNNYFLKEHLIPYIYLILPSTSELSSSINEWSIVSAFLNSPLIPLIVIAILFFKLNINNHLKDGSAKLADSLIGYSIAISFLIGAIIIVNLVIQMVSYLYLFKGDTTVLTQEKNIFYLYEASKTLIQLYWQNSLYSYFIGFILSSFTCIALFHKFNVIVKDAKDKIIVLNQSQYPIITIKKQSGEIKGKIKNVFDNDFIELYDDSINKFTTWENIEIFEIELESEDNVASECFGLLED